MWSDTDFAGLPSISVAAHELKTPITLMRQLGLALQDESLSEAQKARYQQQLITTADRALQLTADLAQVANLQPSLFPLEPVNPLAICRAMAAEMRPMTHLYQRDIVWPRPSRHGLLAVANRRLLERIVANFVDNALKYTEDGVPVRVGVQQNGDYVRVGVRDYGPQLTLREYRRLVDEMAHAKTVRTRPESSGLGIFIASQFARVMYGTIGLIRHRDGVTFYVELPISQQTSWL